ncbi:MAG: hypothetical protein LBH25_05955 [Fibromonadaceae bacterium]|nr:hypothetical protein [Fibromonadaceae bacterium]
MKNKAKSTFDRVMADPEQKELFGKNQFFANAVWLRVDIKKTFIPAH